jgi:hypothetical protein
MTPSEEVRRKTKFERSYEPKNEDIPFKTSLRIRIYEEKIASRRKGSLRFSGRNAP